MHQSLPSPIRGIELMFSLLYGAYERLMGRKELSIAIVGEQGSGKTVRVDPLVHPTAHTLRLNATDFD